MEQIRNVFSFVGLKVYFFFFSYVKKLHNFKWLIFLYYSIIIVFKSDTLFCIILIYT